MQNKDVKNSLSSNRFTFRSETFTNDLPRNLQLMRDLVGSGCGYVEVYLQLISVTSSESYNIKVGAHHVLALTVFNLEAKSTQVKNKFYKKYFSDNCQYFTLQFFPTFDFVVCDPKHDLVM